ncbi:hypothetical protein [Nocardia sp. BMG51109]|uniref:hypothetical protein n=1 Tax=Nocardia sp. BMG51109 TaxID=1056816 RepID=UPI0004650843|nr:hypothetical protein [Nocardia sp. BMG51109]
MNDVVKTLLDLASLPASETEIAAYASGFAIQRAEVDALYAVPEARYVDPALRFRAEGRITDWAQ